IRTFQAADVKVTTLRFKDISSNLSAMNQYDGMVFVDVPATDFSLDQMKTIAGFAHDLGRGLMVVGGQQSFGQGKYDGTPLGDALPVVSGVPGNVQSGTAPRARATARPGGWDKTE